MHPFWILLLSVLGVFIVAVGGGLIYFCVSPMPVIRLLRRDLGDCQSVPPAFEEMRKNVHIEKDLTYSSNYGKNTMDLYFPKAKGHFPLVLWVHGGAFVAGDKSGVENWGVMLANSGYATAVMNYEWAPEAVYPAQIMQITDALRGLAAMATEYTLDMQRVVIAGDSAGAHMAAQVALLHTNTEFAEKIGISSPLSADALRGAMLYCGPYDLKAMLHNKKRILKIFILRIGWSYLGRKHWQRSPLVDTLTPMDFVDKHFVPCYITDGNTGSFESHGRALGKSLRAVGVKTYERYFDADQCGAVNHEYQMQLDTKNAMLCLEDTLQFLRENVTGGNDG